MTSTILSSQCQYVQKSILTRSVIKKLQDEEIRKETESNESASLNPNDLRSQIQRAYNSKIHGATEVIWNLNKENKSEGDNTPNEESNSK